METTKKIVTRFAPSPTGMMHVGGIRTALFAYLLARKNGGTFLLRIEDTDKKREAKGATQQIMSSLKWLGIDWDFGPDKPSPLFGSLIQSERLPIYHEYAQKLLEKKLAYVDPFTEEETELLRKKAEEEKRPFLYRDHRPADINYNWQVGKPLRFKVSEIKDTTWTDLVRGTLHSGSEGLDDFILIKEDGYPTYNFCHIVDDIEMGVTHIMRGEEFIASTPKFISLYEALGVRAPYFVTLPPVLGETGTKKLSKRDGAKSALDYASDGYVSDALFNFLALLGFNPGGEQEIFSKEEIITFFDLSRIQKSGAKFNPEKLDWYNKEYIKSLPKEISTEKMLSYFTEEEVSGEWKRERFSKMAVVALERAITFKTYHDDFLQGEYDYLTHEPSYTSVSLIWKKSTSTATKENLKLLLDIASEEADSEVLVEKIKKLCEEKGNGEILWPLRVALSGKEKSPDPFTLMNVLGKDTAIKRLRNAVNSL